MMNRVACVSIVIPCFNAATTLGETIASALSQEDIDLEVAVVDDGSSDTSIDVLRQFGSAIRVLAGPHRGVSAARNWGISETNSEWIVFLDSDDVLLPGTLRKRLDAANTTGADVIVCDWEDVTYFDGSASVGRVKSLDMSALASDAEVACATDVWATTAALMYRRAVVEKIRGFRDDLPIIQDARFLFDAAYHGARFAHSPHVGARYRIAAQSLSRRDPTLFWHDVFLNGKQIETLWRARGALSLKQKGALLGIFDHAARGFFAAAHANYFEAIDCQRRLGLQLSHHSRFAPHLARVLGLSRARRLLRVIGR
jgi:glycosyltransferase involved in cell wall biosynthesis